MPAREERTILAEAVKLLRDELESGPKSAPSLQAAARSAGVGWRTVERAKASLGVKSVKLGFGEGGWAWRLPDEDRQGSWRSSKAQEVAAFDETEQSSQEPGVADPEDRQAESLAAFEAELAGYSDTSNAADDVESILVSDRGESNDPG